MGFERLCLRSGEDFRELLHFFHSSHVNMYLSLPLLLLKQNYNVPDVVNSMNMPVLPLALLLVSWQQDNNKPSFENTRWQILTAESSPFLPWVSSTENKICHSNRPKLHSSLMTAKHLQKTSQITCNGKPPHTSIGWQEATTWVPTAASRPSPPPGRGMAAETGTVLTPRMVLAAQWQQLSPSQQSCPSAACLLHCEAAVVRAQQESLPYNCRKTRST